MPALMLPTPSRRASGRGGRVADGSTSVRRAALLLAGILSLCACREVRVNQVSSGQTSVVGTAPGAQIAIVRDRRALDALGIPSHADFRREFVVVLLMGPHRESGFTQLIESIKANADRVRIVAFERAPLDGGEPVAPYRTYTMWLVPNIAYRTGSRVEVVTPSGELTASTVLR